MTRRARARSADGTTSASAGATRARLLDAATELFAERGFRRVTVRDISVAAKANVAAVNYHFGDKRRLYAAVLDAALAVVREFADMATSVPADASPEARLRHYVRTHVVRTPRTSRRASLFRELLRHELMEPTGTTPDLVKRALGPRWRYLGNIVKDVLGRSASPTLVADCVLSIQAQCLMPVAAPIALTPVKLRTPSEQERLAEHIVRFSLAGLRARATLVKDSA